LKSLEAARNEKIIGAPLEAHVKITANGDLLPLLEQYARELPGLFIVSEVDVKGSESAGLQVAVERASGVKCGRCWKYTHDVGSDSRLPAACAACAAAIEETLRG
jgi:isoleucyl-tRNA synthetase